jgi:hypothetical protein
VDVITTGGAPAGVRLVAAAVRRERVEPPSTWLASWGILDLGDG